MGPMNKHLIDRLSDAQDFSDLASALVAECEPYGRIHSLHLTHNKRAGRVSCVIEMDSLKQQQAMKRGLGATGLDGSAYLEIPVSGDFAVTDSPADYAGDLQTGYLPSGRASPLTA